MKSRFPVRKIVCSLAMCCLLAAGCTRDKGGATTTQGQPSAGSPAGETAQTWQNGERTWVGLLPCSDCQGVDTRLVLRVRGERRDYLMTETYIGGSGENTFSRQGQWTEINEAGDGEPITVYVLDPDRAAQRFSLQPDGALELLDGDGAQPEQPLAYRLQRL